MSGQFCTLAMFCQIYFDVKIKLQILPQLKQLWIVEFSKRQSLVENSPTILVQCFQIILDSRYPRNQKPLSHFQMRDQIKIQNSHILAFSFSERLSARQRFSICSFAWSPLNVTSYLQVEWIFFEIQTADIWLVRNSRYLAC